MISDQRNKRDLTESIQDDYGERHGRGVIPFNAEAREIVTGWTVKSVGNRPRDWMGRDLLVSSTARDRRNWMFHRLLKDGGPSWLHAHTQDFPLRHRKAVARLRAFHHCYLSHLLQMKSKKLTLFDGESVAAIDRYLRCWPQGLEVKWKGGGTRSERDVCKDAWSCPFCFARRITQLYDRIATTFRSDSRAYLVLISVQPSMSEVEEMGLSVEQFLKTAKRAVLNWLRDFGSTGGVSSVQFLPVLTSAQHWTHCEAEPFTVEDLECRVAAIGKLSESHLGNFHDLPDLQIAGRQFRLVPSVLSSTLNSIRIMLAGHSNAYTGKDKLQRSPLFQWPSLGVSSPEQWSIRRSLTKNRRLFDLWGDWQDRFSAGSSETLAYGRRPRSPKRKRSAENIRRQQAKSDVISALLQKVKPIWEELTVASGRHPGRVVISEELVHRGINASQRNVREVVRRLKQQSTGGQQAWTQ